MTEKVNNFEIIIKPKNSNLFLDIPEIIRYHELLYIFAWRDIKVRYKQTILGVLWAILQPLLTMVVFTIFFGNLAKIPSGGLPYSLFVLCGLVFWIFFSNSLTHASNSMVENENIIKKIYFPRIILPLSSVVTSGIDFVINFFILIIFATALGFAPNPWLILAVFLGVIMIAFTAGGMGLFLSSFNVKYRDVRYILPFFIQILMFLTPVIYSINIIAPAKRYIMALNPMTSVIETVRLNFIGGGLLDIRLILISLVSSILIFLFGLWYFRRTESYFADIV